MTQDEVAAEIAALEVRRADLATQAGSIDASLSQKRRYDPDGKMWDVERYSRWRTSAIYAKAQVNKQLLQVNGRLRVLRAKRHTQATAPRATPDLRALIGRAHALLTKLREEDVEMDPEEIAVIEDLGKVRGGP